MAMTCLSGKTTGRTDVTAGSFLSLKPGKRIVQSVELERTQVFVISKEFPSVVYRFRYFGNQAVAVADAGSRR